MYSRTQLETQSYYCYLCSIAIENAGNTSCSIDICTLGATGGLVLDIQSCQHQCGRPPQSDRLEIPELTGEGTLRLRGYSCARAPLGQLHAAPALLIHTLPVHVALVLATPTNLALRPPPVLDSFRAKFRPTLSESGRFRLIL